MIEEDDWRLRGQERYLKGKTLFFRKWTSPSKDWDHDHCAFCWDKFAEFEGALHEGYTTKDRRHWICPNCFLDFQTTFKWKIGKENI